MPEVVMTLHNVTCFRKGKLANIKMTKAWTALCASSLLITGCLVPVAPHRFIYKSALNKKDSINVISVPGHIQYNLYSISLNLDSVFVVLPIDTNLKKMRQADLTLGVNLTYSQWVKRRESRKLEKQDSIVVKFFDKQQITTDVFRYVPEKN